MNKKAGLTWLKKCEEWQKNNPPEKNYKINLKLVKITKCKTTKIINDI